MCPAEEREIQFCFISVFQFCYNLTLPSLSSMRVFNSMLHLFCRSLSLFSLSLYSRRFCNSLSHIFFSLPVLLFVASHLNVNFFSLFLKNLLFLSLSQNSSHDDDFIISKRYNLPLHIKTDCERVRERERENFFQLLPFLSHSLPLRFFIFFPFLTSFFTPLLFSSSCSCFSYSFSLCSNWNASSHFNYWLQTVLNYLLLLRLFLSLSLSLSLSLIHFCCCLYFCECFFDSLLF